jgi:hypothetical protein
MAPTLKPLSAAGALLLLASCALAGASPSANPPTSRPASVTALPPGPTATARPIPTATAPPATDYEQPAPPLGKLELPDGAAVPGYQGSWCYDETCADIIPPAKAGLPLIDLSDDAVLIFTLAESHPFAYWTVDYSPDQGDDSPTSLAEGGTYVDPDMAPATSPPELSTFTFDAPPAGDWVLAVRVQFHGGLGDTRYYWHAVVA